MQANLELFLNLDIKRKEIKFIALVFFLCIAMTGFSQYNEADSSSVIVHKDPRVDELAKKQAAVYAAIKKASARSMKGYRLLVINTNKRNEAIDAKAKIYTYFPDLKA